MFEPTYEHNDEYDFDVPVYPSCHLCGRVITEEDHTDEAGTDGEIYWDVYIHSPDGLNDLLELIQAEEKREEQVKAESLARFQATVDDAVRDALKARGL